eukprot:PhF_6_TR31744/c0_g1_i1/m.46729
MNVPAMLLSFLILSVAIVLVDGSQATLLLGTGDMNTNTYCVGNGNTASSSGSSISVNVVEGIWFNFVNDAMYYTELNSCTIRQMAYFKGTVSVFAGQCGVCTDGSDNTNPTSTTLKTVGGGMFMSFGVADKKSYLTDRGSHRIRAFDHVNGGAMTRYIGTGSTGTTVNLAGTSAPLNDPINICSVSKFFFIAENGNSRVTQVSKLTSMLTIAVASVSSMMGITAYRPDFYYTSRDFNIVYKCNYVTKSCQSYMGDGTVGNTYQTPPTSSKLNTPNNMYVDCTRRSLYIAEGAGYIFREVDLVTGVSA